MDSLVVSAAEAGRMLGQSEDTIYRWLDQGLLPEMPRWSRRRTIPRAAVERLVDEVLAGFDPGKAAAHLRAAS